MEKRQRELQASSAVAARLDGATVEGVATLTKRVRELEQRLGEVQAVASRVAALECGWTGAQRLRWERSR